MATDHEQIDRDELGSARADRDREREPARLHRHPRCVVAAPRTLAPDPARGYTMSLHCPTCRGPVFAPRDSHGEDLTCQSCSAALVTRRTIDGVDLDHAPDKGRAP